MLSKGGLLAIALAIAFGCGWQVHAWKVRAANSVSVAAAQRNTVLLQRTGNQAEANYLDRVVAEKDRQHERAAKLEVQLAGAARSLNDCRIDGDTLRVLNAESVPGPARVAAGGGQDAGAVAAGSSCAELARTFDANHGAYNLCTEQLGACRQFYLDVRGEYCRRTRAC